VTGLACEAGPSRRRRHRSSLHGCTSSPFRSALKQPRHSLCFLSHALHLPASDQLTCILHVAATIQFILEKTLYFFLRHLIVDPLELFSEEDQGQALEKAWCSNKFHAFSGIHLESSMSGLHMLRGVGFQAFDLLKTTTMGTKGYQKLVQVSHLRQGSFAYSKKWAV
jgi:hypothetical protein